MSEALNMLVIRADVFMLQEAIASQPDGGDSNRKCRNSQASVESAAAPVHGSLGDRRSLC